MHKATIIYDIYGIYNYTTHQQYSKRGCKNRPCRHYERDAEQNRIGSRKEQEKKTTFHSLNANADDDDDGERKIYIHMEMVYIGYP